LEELGPVLATQAAAMDLEVAWQRVQTQVAREGLRRSAPLVARATRRPRLSEYRQPVRWRLGLSFAAVASAVALVLLVIAPMTPDGARLPEIREVRLNSALWRPAANAPQANGGATEELIGLLRRENG
jgi:hypothetical protein